MSSFSLGRLLVDEGLITDSDRRTISNLSGFSAGAFARGILALGVIGEDELVYLLAERTHYRVASKNLGTEVRSEAISAVDPELVKRLHFVPLSLKEGVLSVATVDPLDKETISQIEFFTGYKVKPVIATISQINGQLKKIMKDFQPTHSQFEEFLKNHAETAAKRLKLLEQLDKVYQKRQAKVGVTISTESFSGDDTSNFSEFVLDDEFDFMADSGEDESMTGEPETIEPEPPKKPEQTVSPTSQAPSATVQTKEDDTFEEIPEDHSENKDVSSLDETVPASPAIETAPTNINDQLQLDPDTTNSQNQVDTLLADAEPSSAAKNNEISPSLPDNMPEEEIDNPFTETNEENPEESALQKYEPANDPDNLELPGEKDSPEDAILDTEPALDLAPDKEPVPEPSLEQNLIDLPGHQAQEENPFAELDDLSEPENVPSEQFKTTTPVVPKDERKIDDVSLLTFGNNVARLNRQILSMSLLSDKKAMITLLTDSLIAIGIKNGIIINLVPAAVSSVIGRWNAEKKEDVKKDYFELNLGQKLEGVDWDAVKNNLWKTELNRFLSIDTIGIKRTDGEFSAWNPSDPLDIVYITSLSESKTSTETKGRLTIICNYPKKISSDKGTTEAIIQLVRCLAKRF